MAIGFDAQVGANYTFTRFSPWRSVNGLARPCIRQRWRMMPQWCHLFAGARSCLLAGVATFGAQRRQPPVGTVADASPCIPPSCFATKMLLLWIWRPLMPIPCVRVSVPVLRGKAVQAHKKGIPSTKCTESVYGHVCLFRISSCPPVGPRPPLPHTSQRGLGRSRMYSN